jgi:hypothetical protein
MLDLFSALLYFFSFIHFKVWGKNIKFPKGGGGILFSDKYIDPWPSFHQVRAPACQMFLTLEHMLDDSFPHVWIIHRTFSKIKYREALKCLGAKRNGHISTPSLH